MQENVLEVQNLIKSYKVYDKPIDRLKESISPVKKKYYKTFNALHQVSFSVKKGENIGIIGTNGSGKSTLLKIITGVLSPTSGSLYVNGKVSALLELGAGFNPEYTGLENIYLNGTMMGFSKEEMDKKVDSILEFAGIGDFINQPIRTYSSGMFARLAFAVAINVEPEILIVDEALSVGDTRFQLKCMNRMKEMMSGGTTVLFVSHDISAIKRFCTRVIWLDRGILKADGDVTKVTDEYLDFLKMGDIPSEVVEKEDINSYEEIPFNENGGIAEVVAFYVKNEKNEEVSELELDDPITIEIVYDVYDTNIKNPVIGVAMLGMDGDYSCGLNTLLDKVKIPWSYGRNRLYLEYSLGVRVIGGKYYFDVAIMDETASVNICHKAMIKKFTVKTPYIGEGRIIVPHNWK